MPVIGGGGRLSNIKNSSSLPRKSSKRRRKRQKKVNQRSRWETIELVCTCNMVIATFTALMFFLVGIIFCLLGYHSSSIMQLKDWNENSKPGRYKDQLPPDRYIILQILYNLRIVGPVVMGMGGFLLLCVGVLMYNEKDRLETGKSKMISSDDEIYNKAIKDYMDREETFKTKCNDQSDLMINPNYDCISISYRSGGSFCSIHSTSNRSKFAHPFFTNSGDNQDLQLLPHLYDDQQFTHRASISRDHNSKTKLSTPLFQLAVPRLFKSSRQCSSDSEDVDKKSSQFESGGVKHLLVHQSTTSSSSPTLNLPDYVMMLPQTENSLSNQLISSISYNKLVATEAPTTSDPSGDQLCSSELKMANGNCSVNSLNSQQA